MKGRDREGGRGGGGRRGEERRREVGIKGKG